MNLKRNKNSDEHQDHWMESHKLQTQGWFWNPQSVKAVIGHDDDEQGRVGQRESEKTHKKVEQIRGSLLQEVERAEKRIQNYADRSGCACGRSGVSKAEPLTLFLSRCSGAAARFWSDPWEREEGGRPTPCHAPPSPPRPPDPSCAVMSSPLPDDWHTGKQALLLHTHIGVCTTQ